MTRWTLERILNRPALDYKSGVTSGVAKVGLGCMRLLDADDPEAVVVAALDAGVRTLDTARAYLPQGGAPGDGERTVASALRAWGGSTEQVRIATKVGMLRPEGRPGKPRGWRPDGRAKTLRAQAEQSAEALGRAPDWLLLHAPDPRTALETSLRALAAARDDGLARAIGLCNVGVTALERALAVTPLAAVQVALSPFDDDALYAGLVRRCEREGLLLMVHSPLGGPKKRRALGRHPALAAVAERRGVSPALAALGWLVDLGDHVLPIPGATKVATAAALAEVPTLDARDRERLDASLPGELARLPLEQRQPANDAEGEVVILMGIQAAGKSTAAAELTERGYARLNRDERGGRLRGLVDELERLLASGRRRVVLDNTYPDRASRGRVIACAHRHGVPVRCRWLDTPLPEAQINAVRRLVARYGTLPDPTALSATSEHDPQAFDPRAQFRYERALEPPQLDEGFVRVERLPFERRRASGGATAALVVQLERVLRTSARGHRAPRRPDDVVVRIDRGAAIAADGRRLVLFSWLPDVASGDLDRAAADATLARTLELLGLAGHVPHLYCPHGPGAPRCWCRPPLPGLLLPWLDANDVDRTRSLLVSDSTTDRTMAQRLGLPHADAEGFFD